MREWPLSLRLAAGVFLAFRMQAAVLPPPSIDSLTVSNAQARLAWTPYPAAQGYHVDWALTPAEAFEEDLAGATGTAGWSGAGPAGSRFYRLRVDPMGDDALAAVNALNRLAFGPTPEELERVISGPSPIGADAFIQEQLAPETLVESLDTEPPQAGWTFVTATGTSAGTRFYLYLNGPGQVFVDDIQIVKGTVPESGPNLLVNGDFEAPLAPKWGLNVNYTKTALSTAAAHTGASSLLLSGVGSGAQGNSVYQDFTGWKAGDIYTLSFWYLPTATTNNLKIVASLSGAPTSVTQAVAPALSPIASSYNTLASAKATVATLRAWTILHAIQSRRQLFEILTQFLDNHFVTEHSKSVDFFNRFYTDGTQLDQLATDLEFREISRWRSLLLQPRCTFLDLLQASAESPAQVLYLDTVDSRGDANYIANENYSRELMELYTMGVDNGYDQADITTMSRAWTGWSVKIVDPINLGNPFASQTTNRLNSTLTNNASLNAISNLSGIWTLAFRGGRHNYKEKVIFPGKTVPARFGPPWAGRPYELRIPARTIPNDGMQDGYEIVNHLASLPFTEEFISVKLCRLLVHDDFVHGVYDYRDPNLSEEGKLVHSCMLAWENSFPKGQIREVLKVIVASDLFRRHGGSLQKVKTPLEFCVSAIRALRADLGHGRYSASTDGGSISGRDRAAVNAPMTRMGMMRLYNRVEPNGYPESAPGWISAGTLAERAHFIQSFLMAPSDAQKGDGMDGGNKNLSNPVALLKSRVSATLWTDAGGVSDYFLGILFPGEGRGNLLDLRGVCVRFLNTSDDGKSSSPFSALGPDTVAYDTRVRALVSVLMMSPRFQEQ
ncbi:MAG TPA: hypothetical protein DCM86_02915 [Verrucomicrobiales bacterium]|nr:hypothetical protein [Verrucomicrobiales bacterium]